MNVSFLQELLVTVAERGRSLLPQALFGRGADEDLQALTRALVSGRGEASGVALAREVASRYGALAPAERRDFFHFLADEMGPDPARVARAAHAYADAPAAPALAALQDAVESPRIELFRRLNLAPGATAAIVAMREHLLAEMAAPGEAARLAPVDADLERLLVSWFNRGFLVLRRIDWQTPAAILEKIIRYEAVHAIPSWDDLRRRLDPADRRCFAFFHPALVDEPLIFVEVALTGSIPDAIAPVLARDEALQPEGAPTTAVFYSISNCQPGLKGISFGSFLIKQVVEDLKRETPGLETFVTLSPVPGFSRWLERLSAGERTARLTATGWSAIARFRSSVRDSERHDPEAKAALLGLAAHYLLDAKAEDGRPADPVARFHLGNGASLERINWLADTSEKGWHEALSLMVNYRYDLDAIETNHEAFANDGTIAAHRTVKGLLKPQSKMKDSGARAPALALPLGRKGSGKDGA